MSSECRLKHNLIYSKQMNVNLATFYYADCCTYHSNLEIKYQVGGTKITFRFNRNKLMRIWQHFIALVVVRIVAVRKYVRWVTLKVCLDLSKADERKSGKVQLCWLFKLVRNRWTGFCQNFIILVLIRLATIQKLNVRRVALKACSDLFETIEHESSKSLLLWLLYCSSSEAPLKVIKAHSDLSKTNEHESGDIWFHYFTLKVHSVLPEADESESGSILLRWLHINGGSLEVKCLVSDAKSTFRFVWNFISLFHVKKVGFYPR